MLSEIAEERGLTELAKHIKEFSISVIEKPVYNITVMPEQSCDGCA